MCGNPGVARSGEKNTPAVRQIVRQYWQPDEDTSRCSITDCDTVFSVSWVGQHRHHCRQCGRVVCGACSRGKRLLLPPLGEKQQGKHVRVCNVCIRNSETFEFDQPKLTKSVTLKSPSMKDLFSKLPIPSPSASWAERTLSAASTPPLFDHVLQQFEREGTREEDTGQKRSEDRPIGVDARLNTCGIYHGMQTHEPAAINELLRLLGKDMIFQ